MVDAVLVSPPAKSKAFAKLRAAVAALWQDTNWIVRLTALFGLALVLMAILAPLIAPYDPNAQSLLSRLKPPVGSAGAKPGYLLGTDELGRDILSRCLYGLRLTLGVALLGAMIGLAIGGALGLVAGLRRGLLDDLIMGLVDIQIAVPFTLIALLAVALFGGDLHVLVAVLGIAYWEQYARITRGEVLRLREMPFIEAACASGASGARIAFRHVLPNLVSPLVVAFTVNISNIILLESTLSFLGLGLRPPVVSWGVLLQEAQNVRAVVVAPWLFIPGVFVVIAVLAFNFLGDGLRDAADPYGR
jgi:peptide/nickel transport system permease protein